VNEIGVMAMPADFRYREVFFRGKPRHDGYDAFRLRHPGMDTGKRAKIFAPFDALRGFGETVAAKNILYEARDEYGPDLEAELNRRLTILKNLTCSSRMARENRVPVTVTYYEPCTDENSEAFGRLGRYRTVQGICRGVDDEIVKSILVGETRISFENLRSIESDAGIFRQDRTEA